MTMDSRIGLTVKCVYGKSRIGRLKVNTGVKYGV
jgi:hypothetical protein